jgi:hypothetical protein
VGKSGATKAGEGSSFSGCSGELGGEIAMQIAMNRRKILAAGAAAIVASTGTAGLAQGRVDPDAKLLQLGARFLAAVGPLCDEGVSAEAAYDKTTDSDRRTDTLAPEVIGLMDAIMEIEPRTSAGLAVKARVVQFYWPVSELEASDDPADSALATLLSDTLKLGSMNA